MRLYVDGKNTRTITLYTEAQIVADTGALTSVVTKHRDGTLTAEFVEPRPAAIDTALAGIEFVSALERMDK